MSSINSEKATLCCTAASVMTLGVVLDTIHQRSNIDGKQGLAIGVLGGIAMTLITGLGINTILKYNSDDN